MVPVATMRGPPRSLDRAEPQEHEVPPLSIESVLATSIPPGLKPAAPIRIARPDETSLCSALPVTTPPLARYPPGKAMEQNYSQDSFHSIPWRSEATQHRASSPELETDISRTSSTSTKDSAESALDSSVALQLVAGMDASTEPEKEVASHDEAMTRKHIKCLHALLELLETEQNYARDLRILNQVFFKLLRTVPFFMEVPSRYQMVVRNGPALLDLHTSLSTRLASTVSSLRLGADSERSELERACSDEADEAARAFGKAFTDLAPQFHVYQDFCMKHKESLALIDLVEGRSEWDQFQQRASDAVQHFDDPSGAGAASTPSEPHKRLYFRDYFIKPIQRICLYPIILQNLVKQVPGAGRAELEAAVECMRQVVAEVDRASAQRASLLLSELFLSRMEPSEAFAPTFLPSLGDIHMAGNLDVLYHHPTQAPLTMPLAIKYYGCVLYADYFIICKVRKSYTYVPRFWFPMAEVQVTHAGDRAVALPQSFRLSVRGHHFEMMASTMKELDLWTNALQAVMEKGPARTRRLNGMEVAFPCNLAPTDTHASFNELDPLSLYLSTQSLAEAEQGRGRMAHAHSEILLRQKSPPRRAAKDRSMIFSDACISARTSLDTEGTRAHATLVSPRVGLHRLSGSEYVSVRIPTNEAKSSLRSAPESLSSSPVLLPMDMESQRSRASHARRESADAWPMTIPGSLSRRNSSALLVPLRATLHSSSESETPRVSGSPDAGTPQRSSSMTSLTCHALGRKVSGWLTNQRGASATDEAHSSTSETEAAPPPVLSTTPPWASYMAPSRSTATLRSRFARSSMDAGSLASSGEKETAPPLSSSWDSTASSQTSPRPASVPRRIAKRFLQLNQLSPME